MKRFLIKLSLYVVPFILLYISYILVIKNVSGDIGELGMIPFGKYEVKYDIPSENKVISCYSIDELKNAEIVSVGDSFGKVGGNGCFLNYIGNEIGVDIYRIQMTMDNYKLLDILVNDSSLSKCKVLIVESVERLMVDRLNNKYFEQQLEFDRKGTTSKKNKAGINGFLSYLRLIVDYDNPINKVKLKEDYFTCDYCKNTLYFLDSPDDSDLAFRYKSDDDYSNAVDSLLKLKELGKAKNIKVLYVVATDKYDMYSDFMIENKFGINPTLNYFNSIDTAFFVNTKTLLMPILEDGVKDVYLANDTHWSPIAAEIVGKYIAELIKNENCLIE